MAAEPPTPGSIRIRLVAHGEHAVDVDAVDYAAAQRDGSLSLLFADEVGRIPTDWCLIHPGGAVIYPDALDDRPRPSLTGPDPTRAIALIIAAVPPDPDCAACGARGWPCPLHVARDLVDRVRAEGLVLLPAVEADRIIGAAVRAAGRIGTDPPE